MTAPTPTGAPASASDAAKAPGQIACDAYHGTDIVWDMLGVANRQLWEGCAAAFSPPAVVPESVRRLSEAATQGHWHGPAFSTDIRAVGTLGPPIGMTSLAGDGNGHNDRAFIVGLVNWVRTLLSTPSARADTHTVSGGDDEPSCPDVGRYNRGDCCGGFCAPARPASAERQMADGCCSAVSLCSHQQRDPYSLCEICQKANGLADAVSAVFAPAAPEPAAGGGREQNLRDALHLCLGELDWQAGATNRCGDPDHECPLQDCDNPDDRHLLARLSARSLLSAPSQAETAGGGDLAEIVAAKRAELEPIFLKMDARLGGPRIYMASKTMHAPRWRRLRAEGVPIISTWIDEAGVGETSDFTDLWQRCVDEAATATVVIVYRESGEVLKGAFVEVGAALSMGVPVYAVGCDEFSFVHHAGVTRFDGLDDALRAAVSANAGAEGGQHADR